MSRLLLEARDLVFGFSPSRPLLGGLTCSFAASELVVLAGRNGAGKTLFAKCLAGIYKPSGGELLFEGRALASLPGSPATRVAYLFQDARLQVLGDSLLEDALFGPLALGLPRAEAEARARAALAELGLGGRESEAPSSLSGGELRRLAIASVLALQPPVLILDEPFANLDWQGVADLLALLQGLRSKDRCLIVLTHELEKVLGLADRLLLLDRGRLVAEGSPRSLVGPGLELHGLRNPLRAPAGVDELHWLEAPPPAP